TLYDFIAPESHDQVRATFTRVLASGESSSYECVGHGPHGSMVRYEARLGPIHEGGEIVALLVIAHDITERVEMEIALRASREQLAIAVNASGLGLWEWHVDTDEVVWDETMLRIHGRERPPIGFAGLLDTL